MVGRDWRRWVTTGKLNWDASTAWVLLNFEEMRMSATIMDGTAVANRLLDETRDRAAEFERSHGRKPHLATVLVGEDPASHTYVRMKTNRCRTTGLASQSHHLPQNTSTTQAVELVAALANDNTVDGILVQHPMPTQIDERQVFEAITPEKDVDGSLAHPLQRWHWAALDFNRAHRAASCGCSMPTRLTPPVNVPP